MRPTGRRPGRGAGRKELRIALAEAPGFEQNVTLRGLHSAHKCRRMNNGLGSREVLCRIGYIVRRRSWGLKQIKGQRTNTPNGKASRKSELGQTRADRPAPPDPTLRR